MIKTPQSRGQYPSVIIRSERWNMVMYDLYTCWYSNLTCTTHIQCTWMADSQQTTDLLLLGEWWTNCVINSFTIPSRPFTTKIHDKPWLTVDNTESYSMCTLHKQAYDIIVQSGFVIRQIDTWPLLCLLSSLVAGSFTSLPTTNQEV